MRIHCGLPKTLWADAVSIAAYLINRGPSVPLGFKIPEEVWTGKKNSSTHTRGLLVALLMFMLIQKRETSLMPRL